MSCFLLHYIYKKHNNISCRTFTFDTYTVWLQSVLLLFFLNFYIVVLLLKCICADYGEIYGARPPQYLVFVPLNKMMQKSYTNWCTKNSPDYRTPKPLLHVAPNQALTPNLHPYLSNRSEYFFHHYANQYYKYGVTLTCCPCK